MFDNIPKIYGFNTVSDMGNSVFAPCIFVSGCNFKCPYCMNYKLVKSKDELKEIPIETVLNYLTENKCEWINISGGEPTLSKTELLINLIVLLRYNNLKVGMATNGSIPKVLKDVLCNLNYVAMDFKTPNNDLYHSLSQNQVSIDVIMDSFRNLDKESIRSDFDYEIRTTLHPIYIKNCEDIDVMAKLLLKNSIYSKPRWVFQKFRNVKGMPSSPVQPFTDEQIKKFVDIARKNNLDITVKDV